MPITIQSVMPKSLAAAHGISAGEKILSINKQPVRDFLDLELNTSDFCFELELQALNGTKRLMKIERLNNRPLGIEPEPYHVHNCDNSCVFCFIDQMPLGLRSSLYEKDDDYLFSYVFGNYITLTNLTEADFQRIEQQHITPLYISLHTTDNALRQKMMRSVNPVDVMGVLRRLSKAEISFHLQIVCVPGYNDGSALQKTIQDLLSEPLNCLSVGIVPVGLTKYRTGLCELRSFDRQSAIQILQLLDDLRTSFHSNIIYPADEFYVLAQEAIPEAEFYAGYPQLENGIGMLRLALQIFKQKKRGLLKELRKRPQNYLMISSISAETIIRQIATELNSRLENQSIRVQVIKNDFFGPQITVCGLLTYSDLLQQLSPHPNEIIILPNCIFNSNGDTLDGASKLQIKETWQNPILLIDQFFEDWDLL